MHKNFQKSFYFRIKNDNDCNMAIFTSTSIFLLWLGGITHICEIKICETSRHIRPPVPVTDYCQLTPMPTARAS